MSLYANHSFTSAFPFEIKIENQFMNEGHSTLYIVNKVDEAATEQHVKLLINTVAFGDYALKGFGKEHKPDSTHYNLAIAFRPGTLLKSVEDAFQKNLEDAFNEALKDNGNSCKVSGPVVNERDQAKVWYVCFEQDVDANQEQITGLSEILLPQNDPDIPFSHITGGPDGTYYAIDKWGKLHYYDPQQNQWIKYSWGGHVKSIVAMPNKQFQYVGSDQQLNPATHAPDGPWTPYNPSILLQNNARYGASDQIGVDPSGHLIKIIFNGTHPTTKPLSSKLHLSSACTLPNRHILGVDINHKLHLWNEVKDSWTSITTSENQKFLMVSVDYNNQLIAVGIDHQLYQLGHAVVGQNLLTVNLKGISAAPGNGTRVTQMACHFGNVTNGAASPTFQFKSTTQLNIVNHQGAGYAPLHFGVLGSNVMVKGEKNILKPYFLTKERVPITLGKDTTFTFTLPYIDGNSLPGIGKKDEITEISAIAKDGLFTAELKKPDTTHYTWHFPFKATSDKVGSRIHEGIFEFSNIQVADYRGPVIIEIAVKNLPGYWDSVFQIPVVIGDSSLTDALALSSTTEAGGNTNADGSKIYFNTGGSNGPVPQISIEEELGLNLFGTTPLKPVKVRKTDLLVPEGRLAIGVPKPEGKNHHLFPEGSDATLYIQGDSKLNGKLTVSGAITSDTDHQVAFDTNTFINGWSATSGNTYVRGSLQVGTAPNPIERLNVDENGNVTIGKGSLTVTNGHVTLSKTLEVGESATFKQPVHLPNVSGSLNVEGSFLVGKQNAHGTRIHWNKAGGHGATDLYNIYQNDDPNKFAFQFHQRTGSNNFKTLLSIHRNGRTSVNGALHVNEKASLNGGVEATGLKVAGWTEMHGGFSADSGYLLAQNGWTHIKCAPRTNIPEDRGVAIGWNRTGGHSETNFYNSGYIYDGLIAFQFLQRTHHNQKPRHARELLTITNTGRVGIGTNAPQAPLHIAGKTTDFPNINPNDQNGYFYYGGHQHSQGPWTRNNVALWVTGTILISHSHGASDRRIKQNIAASNSKIDFKKLLQLKIRNYDYVDKLQHSHRTTKGLIAQEVEEVFPEAISQHTEFVPDIFSECATFSFDEEKNVLTCRMDEPHHLEKGDKVKLVDNKHVEYQKEVLVALDAYTFVVQDWTEQAEKIFVYGKKVDDFQAIDYNQISMMGISAIQALHEEVDTLKKENEDLKQGYKHLQEEHAALKSQLQNEMKSLRATMEALKTTPA